MGALLFRADLKLDLARPDYDGAIADYQLWLRHAGSTYTSDGDMNIVREKLAAAMRLRDSVRATPRRHRRSLSADTPSPGSLAVMNLYARLGVDPQCSMRDFKAAFRAKSSRSTTLTTAAPSLPRVTLSNVQSSKIQLSKTITIAVVGLDVGEMIEAHL